MNRILADRYELGSLIGAGGTARVYEARDAVLGRTVAVKLLDAAAAASNDPAGRDRFLAEARSSASFSHRGAVAVYDAGESDGDMFIVMEYVRGESLARVIAARAPMPEAEATRIASELLDALGAAHDVGIVHRDVKPANILIGHDGAVKLADFGIAKRFDDVAAALTNIGDVVGTPRYLAPEQAQGRPTTPAVDIHAVGIILHEMLTGATPAISGDLRTARPDVSPNVTEAVRRALAPEPDDRFASAGEMATALRAAPTMHADTPARRAGAAGQATQVVPALAGVGAGAGGATRVMTPVDAPTQVLTPPPAAAPTVVARASAPPRRELDVRIPEPPARAMRHGPGDGAPRWWVVSLIVIAVVVGGALVLAQRGPASFDPAAATPATERAVEPDDAAPAEPVADGGQAVSDPTETLSVAPLPAPGESDEPVTTDAAPAELIPGFFATDDILVFIAQLREGKDVVGKQSKKLGDKLHKLLEEDDDDRPEEARELAEELREWVEDGEIDPTIAEATLEFIAPLR